MREYFDIIIGIIEMFPLSNLQYIVSGFLKPPAIRGEK